MTLSYGATGFYDDYLKVTKSSAGGVSGSRLLAEIVVAGIAAAVMRAAVPGSSPLTVPFKNVVLRWADCSCCSASS